MCGMLWRPRARSRFVQTLMRLGITAASVLFALAVGAGMALGEIAVYSNAFSTKTSTADLQKVEGGKECTRDWVKADKQVAVEIAEGEARCV
jgi:hypothetical protein